MENDEGRGGDSPSRPSDLSRGAPTTPRLPGASTAASPGSHPASCPMDRLDPDSSTNLLGFLDWRGLSRLNEVNRHWNGATSAEDNRLWQQAYEALVTLEEDERDGGEGGGLTPLIDRPFGDAAVGWRISVYDEYSGRWNEGEVRAFTQAEGLFRVQFDDGRLEWESEQRRGDRWHNSGKSRIFWLAPPGIIPQQPPPPTPPSPLMPVPTGIPLQVGGGDEDQDNAPEQDEDDNENDNDLLLDDAEFPLPAPAAAAAAASSSAAAGVGVGGSDGRNDADDEIDLELTVDGRWIGQNPLRAREPPQTHPEDRPVRQESSQSRGPHRPPPIPFPLPARSASAPPPDEPRDEPSSSEDENDAADRPPSARPPRVDPYQPTPRQGSADQVDGDASPYLRADEHRRRMNRQRLQEYVRRPTGRDGGRGRLLPPLKFVRWRDEVRQNVTYVPTDLVIAIHHHGDEVLYCCFSHNGRLLASCSRDGTTLIYRVSDIFNYVQGTSSRPAIPSPPPPPPHKPFARSSFLPSPLRGGQPHPRLPRNPRPVRRFIHSNTPCRCVWSPDDRYLLVCTEATMGDSFGSPSKAELWDVRRSECVIKTVCSPFDVYAVWLSGGGLSSGPTAGPASSPGPSPSGPSGGGGGSGGGSVPSYRFMATESASYDFAQDRWKQTLAVSDVRGRVHRRLTLRMEAMSYARNIEVEGNDHFVAFVAGSNCHLSDLICLMPLNNGEGGWESSEVYRTAAARSRAWLKERAAQPPQPQQQPQQQQLLPVPPGGDPQPPPTPPPTQEQEHAGLARVLRESGNDGVRDSRCRGEGNVYVADIRVQDDRYRFSYQRAPTRSLRGRSLLRGATDDEIRMPPRPPSHRALTDHQEPPPTDVREGLTRLRPRFPSSIVRTIKRRRSQQATKDAAEASAGPSLRPRSGVLSLLRRHRRREDGDRDGEHDDDHMRDDHPPSPPAAPAAAAAAARPSVCDDDRLSLASIDSDWAAHCQAPDDEEESEDNDGVFGMHLPTPPPLGHPHALPGPHRATGSGRDDDRMAVDEGEGEGEDHGGGPLVESVSVESTNDWRPLVVIDARAGVLTLRVTQDGQFLLVNCRPFEGSQYLRLRLLDRLSAVRQPKPDLKSAMEVHIYHIPTLTKVAVLKGHVAFTTKACPFLINLMEGGPGPDLPFPPIHHTRDTHDHPAPKPTPSSPPPAAAAAAAAAAPSSSARDADAMMDQDEPSDGQEPSSSCVEGARRPAGVCGQQQPPWRCYDFVASGSEDHRVYVWHMRHQRLVSILANGHTDVVNSVSWNSGVPGLLASCGDEGHVCLWSPRRLKHHIIRHGASALPWRRNTADLPVARREQ